VVDNLTREIWLSIEHLEQMLQHVKSVLPHEACGLVAGQGHRSTWVYPVENILHSPVRFRMDPQKQVMVLLEMERKDWDILAIYHSHPEGPEHPSTTDIAEASYPEAAYLIWSRITGKWRCKAYRISGQDIHEVTIKTW
jgi:proteasome lid subunit RPN8/RPN11